MFGGAYTGRLTASGSDIAADERDRAGRDEQRRVSEREGRAAPRPEQHVAATRVVGDERSEGAAGSEPLRVAKQGGAPWPRNNTARIAASTPPKFRRPRPCPAPRRRARRS